jgi:hypothetical protein
VPDGSGGWRVALLADAAASQDVEILNFSKPPETPPASAQLPAEAAGLKPQAPPPPAPTPAVIAAQSGPPAGAPVKPKPAAPLQAAPAQPGAEEDVVDR